MKSRHDLRIGAFRKARGDRSQSPGFWTVFELLCKLFLRGEVNQFATLTYRDPMVAHKSGGTCRQRHQQTKTNSALHE